MKITYEFLKSKYACIEGMLFVEKNIPDNTELLEFLTKLTDEHLDWQSWLIARLLTKENCIRYAIFAAEKVLQNFESIYPSDDRPRKAIAAAKEYLDNPNKKDREAVDSAVYAAKAAAYAAAYAVDAAVDSAAYAADSAVYAAKAAAAYAADSAVYAAKAAVDSAANAATNANTLKEIINYGITLLGKFL
jgi:hypothetical protein